VSFVKSGSFCTCGASESSRATMRLLEYVSKGIAREVERLTSLSREALDHELYREEPWHVNLEVHDDPTGPADTNDKLAV
jgi:hypothetical protein